jgi:hypothetical protein
MVELRGQPGCEIVTHSAASSRAAPMRPLASLLRTPKKAIGIAALLLLAAAPAIAAPGPRQDRDQRLCDSQGQQATLRKLLRHPKSYGGPIANRPRNSKLGLRFDLSTHVRRAKRTVAGNEAAAIQNDAPAARVDADAGSQAALRPLGFLIGPVDSHPRTRAFSPRSPRGPPAAS